MTHRDYIETIEGRYFGSMSEGRPEASVALFAPDAVLTARFSGVPVRVARHDPGVGEETLSSFFSVVLRSFRVSYRDFWHSVDVPGQRVCSLYTLFQFDDGRIREVLVAGVAVGVAVGLGLG
jgi:hypothetical protein